VAALPGFAVERVLTLTAPETAVAGSEIAVAVTVSTNASDGEKIGFLHADYSIDGGVTWTNSWYAERLGVKETRNITFKLGPVGSKAAVRVRVAFRGGKAGDVDYTGKAIDWAGSWSSWRYPPAKSAHTAAIAAP